MTFWLIIAFFALAIVIVFAVTMLGGTDVPDADASESREVKTYRDQLVALDRDLARGTLEAGEADRTRLEISRRLLAADRADPKINPGGRAPKSTTFIAIVLVAALLLGGGYWVYQSVGVNVPGQALYRDMPLSGRIAAAAEYRDTRPSQAEAEADLPAWPGPPTDAEAEYLDLIARLRAAVAERPDDIQGNELLANHEAQLGNFIAAHAAKSRAIAAMQGEAKAGDYAQYVDLLALAADGYVSPEAETALLEIMKLDPENPVGKYYSGLMFAQIGRPDMAFRLWRDLLRDSPADAPWLPPVRSQIGQLAAMAGVDYTLPPLAAPLAGPSAEDMANAADMSAEDRAAFVQNMVSQLMSRLASEGGSAAEWAQLINALGALDRTDRAAAIWQEAQGTFANDAEDLAMVNAAAAQAGLVALEPDAHALRQRQIDDMVTNLSDRLATEGGPAEDWAKLIAGLGELNEPARARQVWIEAQKAFTDHPDQLAIIREAADLVGATE